jgi:hypothetical protein
VASQPENDDGGIREVGLPPADPTERHLGVEISAKDFKFQLSISEGTLGGTAVTVLAGIAASQLLPGQGTFVLIATIFAIMVIVVAPSALRARAARQPARRKPQE